MDVRSKVYLNIFFVLFFLITACSGNLSAKSAVLSESVGEISIQKRQDEDFVSAINGDILNEGGQVQTGEDSRARLDLSTGTIVRMGPSSLFKLTTNTPADDSLLTTLSLDVGKIWIILNGGGLDVETPSGLVAVRGSYMSVDFVNDILRVTCLEGICTFQNNTGEYNIPSGFVLTCTGLDDVPVITPMPEEDIQEWQTVNPEAIPVVATLRAAFTPTLTSTPTLSPSPTSTPTITPTIDVSPNAEIVLIDGDTGDLVSCSERYYEFKVTDPDGIEKVYVEFSSGSRIQVLDLVLVNEAEDIWGGTFNDEISRPLTPTYYSVIVVDRNGNMTTYRIDGVYSFYSRSTVCP